MMYGYKRDGSLTRIAGVHEYYKARMEQFDALPKQSRDWLNYKE